MKQNEFVTTVANVSGLSKAVVRDVLETAGEVVADTLHQTGEASVSVPGFGKFEPDVLTITRYNHETGERQADGRLRIAHFSPGKRLRETVAFGTPL